MKRFKDYRIGLVFLACVLLAVLVVCWVERPRKIDAFFDNNSEDITFIEVVNDTNGSVLIKEKDFINEFCGYLSQVEFDRVSLKKTDNDPTYRYLIHESNGKVFEITFYNNEFCKLGKSDYRIKGGASDAFQGITNEVASRFLNIVFEYEDEAWSQLEPDNDLYTDRAGFEAAVSDSLFRQEESGNDFLWYKEFGNNVNSLVIKVKFWPGTVTPINRASYHDDTAIISTLNLNKGLVEAGSKDLLDEIAKALINTDYYSMHE